MAERRMFSKKITNSAKFLKMPLETQALYFHLSQHADDDGVVEGFTVMRLIGSSEDSIKVLVTKNFIKVLNEDLVIFVIDWLEHNKIRSDRKIDSIYKELLTKQVPSVQLLEPTERSDRKPKVSGTTEGQTMDGIGEVRLGKERLGKVSLEKDNNIYTSFFEKVWILYPRKKGKGGVKLAKKKELYKHGEEAITRCIERYKKEIVGKEDQYILNGSTFFNTRYIDYLDENYEEVQTKEHKENIPILPEGGFELPY